jgi:hypothetical protein
LSFHVLKPCDQLLEPTELTLSQRRFDLFDGDHAALARLDNELPQAGGFPDRLLNAAFEGAFASR